MKQSVGCLLIALIVASSSYVILEVPEEEFDPFAFEQQINETIQGIIDNFTDPFETDEFRLEIPGIGSLDLTNLKAEGQKNIHVPNLQGILIGGPGLNATFVVDNIHSTSNYVADLSVPGYQIGGNGVFEASLIDITIQIFIQLNTTGEVIQVNELVLGLHIGDGTTITLSDIILNGTDLGDTANLLIPALINTINENPDLVRDTISPVLKDLINSILRGDDGGDTSGTPTGSTPTGFTPTGSTPTTTSPTTPGSSSILLPSLAFTVILSLLLSRV